MGDRRLPVKKLIDNILMYLMFIPIAFGMWIVMKIEGELD